LPRTVFIVTASHPIIVGWHYQGVIMLIYSALTAVSAFKQRLTPTTEEAQGLVEYALILMLVAIVALVALAMLGENINNVLYRNGVCVISDRLSNTLNSCG
jgi:Flp pilus assembly pilin Flp